MNVVVTEELTKVYHSGMKKGGITALDNVSLAIEQPEVFGLLGPNGAGKTTFLKVVLGITEITSGNISIAGLPPDKPASRRRVGYLPENHRFPGHLSGLELLEFTGRLYDMSRAAIASRAQSLLKLVGMDRWAGAHIGKYSKGMQQRIGLAQALMPDPEILFLDEPTDGVDPVGKTEIRDVLRKIRDEGKSVLLNSHLLSEVESLADRVAILSHGKVIRVGTVDELTTRESQYEVVAEFGNKLLEIPEDVGKRISLAMDRMVVQLKDENNINWIIDELRLKKINIRSVKPIKITLEQSFIETVSKEKDAGI